jgi:hypothetical protein
VGGRGGAVRINERCQSQRGGVKVAEESKVKGIKLTEAGTEEN